MSVLIAVDRNDNSERLIREGKRLADQFGVGIEVIHVMTRDEFVDLERTSVSETDEAVSPEEVRSVAAEVAEEEAEGLLDEFEAVGRVGKPAAEVVSYAQKIDAEYIVVGIRKRSAVGKAVFGSTAQSILTNSDRPVVVVPRAAAETE